MPVVEDVLGTGDNRVFVADRTGKSILLEVPVKSVEWGRSLCGISATKIEVEPARCTPKLADVHGGAHSLVVFRNDERVWEGPLWRREDQANALVMKALDVVGWTSKRKVSASRNVLGGLVRDHLQWSVSQAFSDDDPNVLAFLQVLGGLSATRTADLTVNPGDKYQSQVLGDMTGNGGRWTALGRSILLWDDGIVIGRLRDLSPENHLEADVTIIEDFDLTATEVTARNDQNVVATATQPGLVPVDPYYGRADLIVSSPASTAGGVAATAQASADLAYPTPLTISIPSSAALRCTAPFPIHRLVPGVLVPVTTRTATARKVTGTFVLSDMKVNQKAGENEKVTITLTPVSEGLAA